jgi:uncharacterized protein (DUF2147 family)
MKSFVAAVLFVLGTTQAMAADLIEGEWLTPRGQTISATRCDDGYCLVMTTGKYAGRQIGRMLGGDGRYEGEMVSPEDGASYSASIEISAAGLTIKGCVGIICSSRLWTRP